MSIDLLDIISYLVVLLTFLTSLGVVWMWKLYFGPDNAPTETLPRSRFLLVLCIKSTLIMIGEWPLAWLAVRRLDPTQPTLGVLGGFILVAVILDLAIAPLVTIGYLFWVRRRRLARDGRSSPPRFSERD